MKDPDVVVIGAGIVGAWIAVKLAERMPDASILVVDRGDVGGGATALSAGLHMSYGRNPLVRQMAAESEIEFQRLRSADPDCPVAPVTFLGVDEPAALAAHAGCFCAPFEAAALEWGSLGPVDSPLGALQVGGAHYADVPALARRLLRRAGPQVQVVTGRAVVAIEGAIGAPRLRLNDGGTISARAVAAAPGPWLLSPPFQGLGVATGVRIKKIVSMTVGVEPRLDDPAVFFLADDAFLLPRPDLGEWLFSYTCQTWDVSPDRRLGVELGDIAAATAVLVRHRADLAVRLSGARVFCDAYTPERAPQVVASPVRPDVVLALGCGGSGHRLAPALAKRVGDLTASVLQREAAA